jgi:hypothetical protein
VRARTPQSESAPDQAAAKTSPTSTLSIVTAMAGASCVVARSALAESSESKTTMDAPFSYDTATQ